MLTPKQRARVEKALASDGKPTGKPAPPPVAQLLDWLEGRALGIFAARRTSKDQPTWELAWRAQRERDWLAKLPEDRSWATAGGATWKIKWKRQKLEEDLQRADRAIASLHWVGHARNALVKRDTAALAFAMLMAERSLHDPEAERSLRERRAHSRRVAPSGGKERGAPNVERDKALERAALGFISKHGWNASAIGRELKDRDGKGELPAADRIADIIRPALKRERQKRSA